jgi:hypothetical protein
MECGRRKTNENKFEIETMEFEKVHSFRYLGSVLNQKNEIGVVKAGISLLCYHKDVSMQTTV